MMLVWLRTTMKSCQDSRSLRWELNMGSHGLRQDCYLPNHNIQLHAYCMSKHTVCPNILYAQTYCMGKQTVCPNKLILFDWVIIILSAYVWILRLTMKKFTLTVMGIDISMWQKFILLVSEINHFSIVINTTPWLGGFGILPEIGCLSFLSAYFIITRYWIKWY